MVTFQDRTSLNHKQNFRKFEPVNSSNLCNKKIMQKIVKDFFDIPGKPIIKSKICCGDFLGRTLLNHMQNFRKPGTANLHIRRNPVTEKQHKRLKEDFSIFQVNQKRNKKSSSITFQDSVKLYHMQNFRQFDPSNLHIRHNRVTEIAQKTIRKIFQYSRKTKKEIKNLARLLFRIVLSCITCKISDNSIHPTPQIRVTKKRQKTKKKVFSIFQVNQKLNQKSNSVTFQNTSSLNDVQNFKKIHPANSANSPNEQGRTQ